MKGLTPLDVLLMEYLNNITFRRFKAYMIIRECIRERTTSIRDSTNEFFNSNREIVEFFPFNYSKIFLLFHKIISMLDNMKEVDILNLKPHT